MPLGPWCNFFNFRSIRLLFQSPAIRISLRPYSPTMILGPWPRIYSMRTLASGRSQSRLGAGVRIAVTRGTDQGNRAMHESLKISGLWLRMNPMRSLPRGTQTQFAANERTTNDSICWCGFASARAGSGFLHRDLWVRNDAQVRGRSFSRPAIPRRGDTVIAPIDEHSPEKAGAEPSSVTFQGVHL